MKPYSIRMLLVAVIGAVALPGQTAAQRALLPGETEAVLTAIPGVIAGGEEWEIVWAGAETADGMVATADGGILFAQEATDKVFKLDRNHNLHTFLEYVYGVGSVSVDAQGRVYAVERTCTEPLNPELAGCDTLTRVSQVFPEYRILANSFPDGTGLGRLNDLVADGRGGAYFTSGGVYYVNSEGRVSIVADQDIGTNGLALSRNGRTLYVTNGDEVVAFDVAADGATSNRRVFGSLNEGGGDGMAIDAEGRLYVTGSTGVHVLAEDGRYLGRIPTHRRPITVAISGPGRRTLYVSGSGVIGPDGGEYTTPDGIRNVAKTIYAIDLLAQGYPGRP